MARSNNPDRTGCRGSNATDEQGPNSTQAKRNGRDNDRIALDTSVLMAAVEADVRPFEELDRLVPGGDYVVPARVVSELESLSNSGGEEGQAATVGRDLARRCRVVEVGEAVDGAVDADDVLVALAAAGRVDYVATNDRPLRDRILARDVPVIGLRGRNKFAVTRP